MRNFILTALLATSLLADNVSTLITADSIVVIEGDRTTVNTLVSSVGGYLVNNPYLLPNHTMAYMTIRQMREISSQVGYIFPASVDLILGTPVVGCKASVVTTSIDPVSNKEVSIYRYGWDGPGLGHATLTYTFGNTVANGALSSGEVRAEVLAGLTQWSYYADIDFLPGIDPLANYDLNIFWATGEHGLNDTFIGELAHGFYPPWNMNFVNSSVYGDVHFNNEYIWGRNTAQFGNPYDVKHTATHEGGHALGLAHSDDYSAMMYPYYDGRKQTPMSSDIDSIRALYGFRDAVPPPTPGTREARGGAIPFSLLLSPSGSATTSQESIVISGTFSGGATPYNFAVWNSDQGGFHGALTLPTFSVAVPLVLGANTISLFAIDANGTIASGVVVVNRIQNTGGRENR